MNYDFSSKRRWRHRAHVLLRKWAPRQQQGLLLLMLDRDPREIRVALAQGWKESQIIVANENPAIPATHKRSFPAIKTLGRDVCRAVEKFGRGSISAANLDFCGNLSGPTLRTIRSFVSSDVLADGAALVVNALAGREEKRATEVFRLASRIVGTRPRTERSKIHADRFAALWYVLTVNGFVSLEWESGVYTSESGQPFLWSAFRGVGAFEYELVALRTAQMISCMAKRLFAEEPSRARLDLCAIAHNFDLEEDAYFDEPTA